MTRRLLSPLHTLPLWFLFAAPLSAEETSPANPTAAKPAALSVKELRPAIEKGLAFLEKEGLAWMNQRKCIACHHGAFLLWSHNEARTRGFTVETEKLNAWTTQALNLYLAGEKDALKKKNGAVETTNMLLGQVTTTSDEKLAQELKRLSALLVNAQKPDGFWKYEGQGQNRPDAEADEATTLWAVLALTLVEKTDPAYPKARESAFGWLKTHQTGAGNEPAVLRVLIEARFGEPARVKERAQELIGRQNADGSWSWGKTYPGDAFATGQSLYALGEAGLTGDHPSVQRAWKFLLEKQKPDGSFFAPSKKPNVKENSIATYWGSAWATIGLLHTLPAQGPDPAKKPEQPKNGRPGFRPSHGRSQAASRAAHRRLHLDRLHGAGPETAGRQGQRPSHLREWRADQQRAEEDRQMAGGRQVGRDPLQLGPARHQDGRRRQAPGAARRVRKELARVGQAPEGQQRQGDLGQHHAGA